MHKILLAWVCATCAINANAGILSVDGNEHWGLATDNAVVMCDGSGTAWDVTKPGALLVTEAHRDRAGNVMKCLSGEETSKRLAIMRGTAYGAGSPGLLGLVD
jgi:hypothetical protein